MYGSFGPFRFQFSPYGEALARYRAALAIPLRVESRSDGAANILLFISLSFLGTGS